MGGVSGINRKEGLIMFDIVRRALLAGIGAQEKAKELVEELVKKGELNQSEGAKLIKEVMEKAEKGGAEVDKTAGEVVQKTLETLNLPTRKDIESLEKKVQDLTNRLKRLEEAG